MAARHRLAGRWAEQPAPVLTSGKITYEVGDYVEATPYGGLAAMHHRVVALRKNISRTRGEDVLIDEIRYSLQGGHQPRGLASIAR